jgi:acyl-CoA synthetase (AMP-forming)/AMP-acid ligase II
VSRSCGEQEETEPVTHIGDLLARSAALFPDRPALQTHRQSLSYRELAEVVRATTQDLRRQGLGRGDRILIVGTNGVRDVALLFALTTLGAWPVLVSARIAPLQLDAIIRHCEPRVVLFVGEEQDDARRLALLRSAEAIPFSAFSDVWCERYVATPEAVPPTERDADVAALIYTSGSTGTPKAVMLSHRNLVYIALTQQRLRRYTQLDKTYCPLPIAHVGALGILMCVTAAGACLYLAERFVPAELAAAIRAANVTVVPGLPPLHVKFLEWATANSQAFDKSGVRLVTTSSSPLHEPVKRAVERLYGCPLQNAYGLSEATGVVFQVEAGQWRDDVSVGPPIPGVSVRIATANGSDAPPGEPGEILVRGPNVFVGYYRNAEATRATFTADGWLRTGDLAYFGDGVAFIAGRAKEMIKRSGYCILPTEIEAALNEHPGVALSAVVAGQRAADEEVVAFVQLKQGTNAAPDELIVFLHGRVAPYELPGAVRLLAAVPTLNNGKIDRVTLRRWASEAPG